MEDGVISSLSQLGPALGSVVVLAFICRELLKLFKEHMTTMKEMNSHLNALSENIKTNTEVTRANTSFTQQIASLFERKSI